MLFQNALEFSGFKPDALTDWAPIKLNIAQVGYAERPASPRTRLAALAPCSIPKLLLEGTRIKVSIMAQRFNVGVWKPISSARATSHSGVTFRGCRNHVSLVDRALWHGFET
jgi:hypothetical protein